MTYIENKIFDEIKIGDSAGVTRTLTQRDLELFTAMSGDVNPTTSMWGASILSNLIDTRLPGAGVSYLSQTLNYQAPIALGDTITGTVTISAKNSANHHVELDYLCVNQHGETVINGLVVVIASSIKTREKCSVLPNFVLKRPASTWYQDLINLKNNYSPLKTAVVHAVDELSLRGAIDAAEAGLIIPIFVAPKEKLLAVAKQANIDISAYELIESQHSHDSAEIAVKLARQGKVEALMKGKIHTDELMEPVIDKINGLRTGRRMSHVFAIEAPNYFKPLFLTDAAINIRPNLQEKKDIVQNAIDLFFALGLGTPNVAILSAVETVSEKIPSTLDATALCKMAERGQITGGILDGPLALDNAISIESAREKNLFSAVAGNADILVVPDVESGNILYKQMTFLSGMEAAGIVLGATVPIILTSRSSDILSRKASSVMALVYTRNQQKI